MEKLPHNKGSFSIFGHSPPEHYNTTHFIFTTESLWLVFSSVTTLRSSDISRYFP